MIKLNEKLYIDADTNNYILVSPRGTNKKGEPIYVTLGFYNSIETLLNGIGKNELREYISKKEIDNLDGLAKEMRKVRRLIEEFTKTCNL